MPARPPHFDEKIKRAIRDAIALDPLISKQALGEHLEQLFERPFDHRYISKLCEKVLKQARTEVDRSKMNERIAQLRETHRIARERLLKILFWSQEKAEKGSRPPLARDQVEAAKNLVMLDIAMLNAEVANGVYKNLDAAAADLKYPTLPEERRQIIVSAFEKWGILPPNSIQRIEERVVTMHATTRVITAPPNPTAN